MSAPRPHPIKIGRLQMKVVGPLLRAAGARMADARVYFPDNDGHTVSATEQAVLDALTRSTRAVTIHELDAIFSEHGLSNATSRVASHGSPLLRRVCYGVYALLGQSPAEEEVEAACQRLEMIDSTSILESSVLADGRVRVRYAPAIVSGKLPLPKGVVQPGWWKFTDLRGSARSVEISKDRVGRMRRKLRHAVRHDAAWLELLFDDAERRIEWEIGPGRLTVGGTG
jgi:hypothetical protein